MARLTRKGRRRKSPSLMHDISLTPLIDMSLTLLIIFMVTAPMMNSAIHVDLPKGHVKEEVNTRPDLVVSINNEKKLFLNDEPKADLAALVEAIQRLPQATKGTVFIRADREVEWGYVAEFAGSMMKGGIEHVAFATTTA